MSDDLETSHIIAEPSWLTLLGSTGSIARVCLLGQVRVLEVLGRERDVTASVCEEKGIVHSAQSTMAACPARLLLTLSDRVDGRRVALVARVDLSRGGACGDDEDGSGSRNARHDDVSA